MQNDTKPTPAKGSCVSERLQALLSEEMLARRIGKDASPEQIFRCYEHIYAVCGEAAFDAGNPADAMVMNLVIIEANENAGSR